MLGLDGGRPGRLVVGIIGTNCRRQHREIDPLVINIARGLATPDPTFIVADAPVGPVTPGIGAIAHNPGRTLLLRLLVGVAVEFLVAVIVAVRVHPLVAVIIAVVIVAGALLFVEPRTCIAEHTEIMIRELQIIFGLHAIAGQLGVTRHALILFEQLGGIAALAIILAIAAVVAGHTAGLLSPATATAAALTIVDQTKFPYRTGALRRKTSHSEIRPSIPQQSGAPEAPGPLSSRVRKFAA